MTDTEKKLAFLLATSPYLDTLDGKYEVAVKDLIANGVVPVVRCKECKHYHAETGWCDKHSHFVSSEGEFRQPWESIEWKMFEPDYFCADGERKDGE